MTVWLVSISQAAGPPKKSKPTTAAGGKSKKAPETREVAETELSVSHMFEWNHCNINEFYYNNKIQVKSRGKDRTVFIKKKKNLKTVNAPQSF